MSTVTTHEPVAVIRRSKLYPTPGRNYHMAWKWTYTVAWETGS